PRVVARSGDRATTPVDAAPWAGWAEGTAAAGSRTHAEGKAPHDDTTGMLAAAAGPVRTDGGVARQHRLPGLPPPRGHALRQAAHRAVPGGAAVLSRPRLRLLRH